MRPKVYDFDLVDVDVDLLVEAETLADAGDFTLTGSTLDYARRLVATSVGNDSGVTFTFTGLDQDGKALVETMTGPNTTTGTTTGYFSSVTSIASDGATAADVTVGTVDEIISQTIPVDYDSDTPCAVSVDVTGALDYTIQETFDEIQTSDIAVQSAHWFDIFDLSDKTVDTQGRGTTGASAIRFVVNSHSSGGEAQMTRSQPAGR